MPRILLLVIFVGWSSASQAELRFFYEDRFSESEQAKLETWIDEVAGGIESLVGPYPFDVHIRFARARSREPVPWANTLRGRDQGVRFNVDPRHTLEDFRRDWTAPHELSHLILPYLGRDDAWFSEGFASYMQHQVMYATGAWTREGITQRYQRRLDEGARKYKYPDRPYVDVVHKLRAQRKFRTLYWGGAVYFLNLDQKLKANHNTSLRELLSTYLHCCRRHRDDLDGVIASFDRLIRSEVSAKELARFRATPGFPHYGRIDPSVVD
ncbi:MAG: hypothetical protein OER80_01590 [Gammaproteobacteria bacterium]|nr:hypothetical protein [Gammaproteobacteria bacterium]MDH3767904.1 hypothetical protein [Gammaproteobacteria bacterium]